MESTSSSAIEAMLKQPTGSYLTDSGSIYGSHWERNQGVTFEACPQTSDSFHAWQHQGEGLPGRLEINSRVSLYHWMVNNLELDQALQAKLEDYGRQPGNECLGGLALADCFADDLHESGDSAAAPGCYLTYNYPDRVHLGQDVQFYTLFMDDSQYEPSHLVLSVHGGCDIRGGFSEPKVFKLRGDYDDALGSMHISGWAAGDNVWDWVNWNTVECGSENACTESLNTIPAYELSWLIEDPEFPSNERAMYAAIQGAELAKTRLGETSMSPEQKAAAAKVMDEQVKSHTEKVQNACVEFAASRHDWFFIVADGKALLFNDTASRMEHGEPLSSFVNF